MKFLIKFTVRLSNHFATSFYSTNTSCSVLGTSQARNGWSESLNLSLKTSFPLSKKLYFGTMTDNTLYVGTSVRGITKEIEIPVPWGVVAGKTYGESCNPPVLCLHGWLDNCNTFDSLIPMLPKDRFYVFLDLPGHGRSSGIPVGAFYSSHNYLALIHRIADHFSWSFFSLLSHSLGGNISALYAGTFPESVDKLILLDCAGVYLMPPGGDVATLRSSIESYAKFEKQLGRASSTYSYKEAKERLLKANNSLTSRSADILLERGAIKQEDGTYKYARDIRHIFRNPSSISVSSGLLFLSNVRAETMHLIAKDGPFQYVSEEIKEMSAEVIQNGFKSCEHHSYIEVEGMHHMHLCNPDNVIEHITTMLNRPPRSGLPKEQPSTQAIDNKL